jgi:quinol monooxygenase YgiN
MYGLVVKFEFPSGIGVDVDQVGDHTIEGIRKELGTLLYRCHEVERDSNARMFYEDRPRRGSSRMKA